MRSGAIGEEQFLRAKALIGARIVSTLPQRKDTGSRRGSVDGSLPERSSTREVIELARSFAATRSIPNAVYSLIRTIDCTL